MTRLLLLALLLSACSGSRQDRWTPDAELTAPAMQAAEDWCCATDGRYCPQIVGRGGLPIAVERRHVDGHIRDCGWIRLRNYGADVEPQRISVSRPNVASGLCEYGATGLVGLLRHELGHAAGLLDVDDPGSIMHRTSAQSGEISDADVAEMGEINDW